MRKLQANSLPPCNTFEPNPDGYSLILNGVVRVATGWNARAAALFRRNRTGGSASLLPPEGSVFQINTLNLAAGSKNTCRQPLAFVKLRAWSQQAQKAFTERMFYAPTNATRADRPASAVGPDRGSSPEKPRDG